jgi:hypothetical protein
MKVTNSPVQGTEAQKATKTAKAGQAAQADKAKGTGYCCCEHFLSQWRGR